MAQVTGVTNKGKTDAKVYWYWTELGPHIVDLTDKTQELPAGRYTVYWDMRGAPNAMLTFDLMEGNKNICAVADSIPVDNNGHGKASKEFVVA